ncbi:MAG: HAD-IIIA family hydrolase [Bacteroidales bacterium]|nr:HAD-IIIA family hydrolase [Bacteroidales bacterium]
MLLLKSFKADKSWNLFLDRDGVINKRLMDKYVLSTSDFEFIDGVVESIAWFSGVFNLIFVVTNQQGIGKGMMTEQDLKQIHDQMIGEIESKGGRIDKIYHCPALKDERSFYRKPLPGMAIKAKKDFPEIEFKRSVMVGDTLSDMRFGKSMKMVTVFIGKEQKVVSENHSLIDYAFESLFDFKVFLEKQTIESQNSR